ncbi:MAG: hypothetical protein M3M96_01420 [Candidatus Eremiobacteraeota bacterium]|nr:hypothetical protein [Candidatus Eremiobacteraeota bacterium]
MEHNNADLDDMKARWAAHDRDLDMLVVHLNRHRLFATHVQPAVAALGWLRTSAIVELVFTAPTLIFLGSFTADHIAEMRFALPAFVLGAMALVLTAMLVAQIVVSRRVDYAQPVVAIQKTLATLRTLRIRYVQGILLGGTLAWPLIVIVLLKQFDIDAYAVFGSAYIWANVLAGIAVICAAIWFARTYGERVSGSRLGRYLADVISGSSLQKASRLIATVDAFERD